MSLNDGKEFLCFAPFFAEQHFGTFAKYCVGLARDKQYIYNNVDMAIVDVYCHYTGNSAKDFAKIYASEISSHSDEVFSVQYFFFRKTADERTSYLGGRSKFNNGETLYVIQFIVQFHKKLKQSDIDRVTKASSVNVKEVFDLFREKFSPAVIDSVE